MTKIDVASEKILENHLRGSVIRSHIGMDGVGGFPVLIQLLLPSA